MFTQSVKTVLSGGPILMETASLSGLRRGKGLDKAFKIE
jgi:hypothetical protein